MLWKVVAVVPSVALLLAPAVVPSPPPTMSTTMVLRHVGSLLIAIRRLTSVFASFSMMLTGVSNVFESSAPAGISASVVAPVSACRASFPRVVSTSAFAVAESA